MTEFTKSNFINNGINVHLVELGDKDPSDLGYIDVTKIKQSTQPVTGDNLMLKQMGINFGDK